MFHQNILFICCCCSQTGVQEKTCELNRRRFRNGRKVGSLAKWNHKGRASCKNCDFAGLVNFGSQQLLKHDCTVLLPACEFDGQYEQRAEHDSPTEESRPPGHQEQHLAERLAHPAQHYSQSWARRPIYTARSKLDTYSRSTKRRGEDGWFDRRADGRAKVDWTRALVVSGPFKHGYTNLFFPRRLYHFRKNASKGVTAKCCLRGVHQQQQRVPLK